MTKYNDSQIDTGSRLGAMILDHFIMSMVAMGFFIPGMISSFVKAFNVSHEQQSLDLFGEMKYLGLLGFAIYFCKDCINGRSIAKRILKLQVVDNSSGQAASPIKCFVRNIFCIFWPLEVLLSLINPSRRLGDRVAGTKVVVFDPLLDQPKLNIRKMLISVALAYGLMLLFMLPFNGIMSAMGRSKVDYLETSFNQKSSKELEQLLADSLREYFTPDIRIYDKVQHHDVKYISAILHLKENYLDDEHESKRIDNLVTNIIYLKFPEQTITGQVKSVFEASGHMQSSSHNIGVRLSLK